LQSPDAPNVGGLELIEAFLEEAGRQAAEPPGLGPVTIVGGSLFGGSIHLNDSYFLGSLFGIPTAVCHGVTGIGTVGPPNSFRFATGAGQLQFYQSLRDTAAISTFIGGASVSAASFAPSASVAAVGTGSHVVALGEGQSMIGWVMNGRVVAQSLPITSHASLGTQAGLVCEGQAVTGATAFTVIKAGGILYVLGSRNFGGTLVVSEATRQAVLAFFK
jgi:hypothetical protein